jgi:lysyl-tRNA synthetase class II
MDILESWRQLGESRDWTMTLRITPTPITVSHFHTVYEYALQHNFNVESCNFLHNPRFMRITVLPAEMRERLAKQLEHWISQQNIQQGDKVLNIRNPDFRRRAVIQDAQSYVEYLRNGPDETARLGELVSYLQKIDNNRGISVLDYCPEYEELFRSAGY